MLAIAFCIGKYPFTSCGFSTDDERKIEMYFICIAVFHVLMFFLSYSFTLSFQGFCASKVLICIRIQEQVILRYNSTFRNGFAFMGTCAFTWYEPSSGITSNDYEIKSEG